MTVSDSPVAGLRLDFILGPCPCQTCRQPVSWNGHVWLSGDNPHRCPRTMDDPELGPVRLCRPCREYWPFDQEFWYWSLDRWVCKACHRDAQRRKREKRLAA